jgi:cytochrome c2
MRRVVRRFLLGAGLLLVWPAHSGLAQVSDNGDSDVKFSLQAAATFNTRCTACHTYGKGIKVGPDLKDVTKRRKREWLLKFIQGSSLLIKSGDATAAALFSQFKQQRMPDWVDLSDKQVNDILDFITVGGPDIKPADERNAEKASAAERETGRKLFYGETPLKYGAQACATCHSVAGGGLRGGGLGPDLSDVYLRYQDLALTQFLRHPCFTWERTIPAQQYLTVKESFALKAFLHSASLSTRRSASAARTTRPDGLVAPGGKDQ